jgi:hypothetical protein
MRSYFYEFVPLEMKVTVGGFRKSHRSWNTEVLVHRIIGNKIRALGGLLRHERKDPTVEFNFLDRFGLFHEGVGYSIDQAKDALVAIHLSQDGL